MGILIKKEKEILVKTQETGAWHTCGAVYSRTVVLGGSQIVEKSEWKK